MIITPQLENFENDRYDIRVFDGYVVSLIIVDESFEDSGQLQVIKRISIFATITTDTGAWQFSCPNIIGLSNELLSISSDDPELLGTQLTGDLIGKWSLTINE